MKKALVLATVLGAKHLIAKALAKRLSSIKNRRIYIAYGSTNNILLEHLGIEKNTYYSGYVSSEGLKTNKDKPEVVVLNADDDVYMEKVKNTDIIIKGANALSYESGAYFAAVAAASAIGGTFGRVCVQAACVGAEVIIPIGHEKMVPKIERNVTQDDFDLVMGRSIALLPISYGEIYTEIEAFKELFDLDASVITSGGILGSEGAVSFSLSGQMSDLESAVAFLSKYNGAG